MTALAVALLAAAALVGTAAYYCLTHASRLIDEALREQADADNFDTHCDELLAIVHDTQPGRDENARLLLEEMWRQDVAKRRNTGRRPT